MLRKHQKKMHELMLSVKHGSRKLKQVIASVTPGGGKSVLPVIALACLYPKHADRICWVVPRIPLQEQAEGSFLEPKFRHLLDHKLSIRASTNEPNPCRDGQGYVTTYAALVQDSKKLNAAEFARHRYILVLDEPHHVAAGSAYERALKPLVEKAVLVVYMSGTLERDDRRHISFLPYRMSQDFKGEAVDLSETESQAVIEYSRADALSERAIIRMYCNYLDARAEWVDREGMKRSVSSIANLGKSSSQAVWTAIHTEYATSLLKKTIDAWRMHRMLHPRSKLLVVAATQVLARKYAEYLKTQSIKCGIATMDEGPAARKAIRNYKTLGTGYDALVTVQMAYEGLDVPSIDHIACLTNIRSVPWLEQMLARATRYDRMGATWTHQAAHVWMPDDEFIRHAVKRITSKDEQLAKIKGESREVTSSPGIQTPIKPTNSGATSERQSELISPEEAAVLQQVMKENGVVGVSPLQMKAIINQAGYGRAGEMIKTPSEQEAEIREKIENHVRRFSMRNGKDFKTLNRAIVAAFGKSRRNMSIAELKRVLEFVEQRYPMSGLFA